MQAISAQAGTPTRINPQADVETGRSIATKLEILAASEQDAHDRKVNFRRDRACNIDRVYRHLVKWMMSGGNGTVSQCQIVRDLYGHDLTLQQLRSKRMTVRRALRALERQSLVRTSVLPGKCRGLCVELLTVPEALCIAVCSSSPPAVVGRRRRDARENVREARVRRWCPRAGRNSPRDWPFISTRRIVTSGGSGEPLKGSSPDPTRTTGVSRAGPGGTVAERLSSADATAAPQQTPDPVAALEDRVTAAAGAVGLRTWLAAEQLLVDGLGEPTGERLRSLATIQRLLWVLRRLDRYGNFGAGREGAGLAALQSAIEGWQQPGVAAPPGARPRHLAYFLPELEETGRRWKHTHAPRIKAERKARGAKGKRRKRPLMFEYRRPQP